MTENKLINKKIVGLKPSKNSIEAFKKTNVIIDFTIPKCTLEILKIASKLNKKVIIGTTGFSKRGKFNKKFSRRIPILKAGNEFRSKFINVFNWNRFEVSWKEFFKQSIQFITNIK